MIDDLGIRRFARATLGRFVEEVGLMPMVDEPTVAEGVQRSQPFGVPVPVKERDGASELAESARRLSFIAQEMSTFGAPHGSAVADWPKTEQLQSVDFFA